MRKFLISILLISFGVLSAQKIPILKLRNNISTELQLPQELKKNELCMILQFNQGWSAYDTNLYYFFGNKGDLRVYQEQFPKSHLRDQKEMKTTLKEIPLTEESRKSLFHIINSPKIKTFQQYSQSNFINKLKAPQKEQNICVVSDAAGYGLTFIQNKKMNEYDYYAPQYYLENCNDPEINKAMLRKYVDILNSLLDENIIGKANL